MDANRSVLSVPPVINAESCRITSESRSILIEVSGPEGQDTVQQVAEEFLNRFAAAYKAESSSSDNNLLQVAPVCLLTPVTNHVRLIWPRP